MTPAARPPFRGVLYIGLSVTDLQRSIEWYCDVFGFGVFAKHVSGSTRDADGALLVDNNKTFWIGLLQHGSNPGEPFSEFRTGLDHVEFAVASIEELEAWVSRLDELGVQHSGIKHARLGKLITFRDPDNIQLEFFMPTKPTAEEA